MCAIKKKKCDKIMAMTDKISGMFSREAYTNRENDFTHYERNHSLPAKGVEIIKINRDATQFLCSLLEMFARFTGNIKK
jgi:hypothetical protein